MSPLQSPRAIAAAAIIAAAAALAPLAAAQQQSRLSTDIIDTYSAMIADDPASYDLYLSRATEYAAQGLLSPAIDDLNTALRLTPAGDKDMRYEILSLRAAVNERMMNPEAALADIEAASAIRSDLPALLLSRGRVLISLRRYPEAREAFTLYRRHDPRSSEALFGLAKASALEGDSNTALGYANDAVNAAGNSAASLIARGEIMKTLGRRDDAITEYIAAMNRPDDGAGAALQHIVDMSYENYPEVIDALDRAISKAPTAGALYYLRASIAQAHSHHAAALADYEYIDGSGPFAGGALGAALAESLIALRRPAEALEALDRLPAPLRGPASLALRSRALASLGEHEQALAAADSALAAAPDMVEAMELRARALISLGRKDEASVALATALMTDPSSAPALYLLRSGLVSPAMQTRLLEEAAELPFDPADPASLRGFALAALGRTDEAEIWARSLMRLDEVADGVAHATAAALLAATDKPDEAVRALGLAIDAGYDDLRFIFDDDTPLMSLAPLRGLPSFKEVTSRLSSIAQGR